MFKKEHENKILLMAEECAKYLGMKKTKFYADVLTDVTFPRPIMIGKTKFWRTYDVEEWVMTRKAIA